MMDDNPRDEKKSHLFFFATLSVIKMMEFGNIVISICRGGDRGGRRSNLDRSRSRERYVILKGNKLLTVCLLTDM